MKILMMLLLLLLLLMMMMIIVKNRGQTYQQLFRCFPVSRGLLLAHHEHLKERKKKNKQTKKKTHADIRFGGKWTGTLVQDFQVLLQLTLSQLALRTDRYYPYWWRCILAEKYLAFSACLWETFGTGSFTKNSCWRLLSRITDLEQKKSAYLMRSFQVTLQHSSLKVFDLIVNCKTYFFVSTQYTNGILHLNPADLFYDVSCLYWEVSSTWFRKDRKNHPVLHLRNLTFVIHI